MAMDMLIFLGIVSTIVYVLYRSGRKR